MKPGFIDIRSGNYRILRKEVEIMVKERIQRVIKLSPSEVRDFVRVAEKCDFDIDISYGHVVVDAKSILGILGLDLTRKLTVSFFGENKDFESYLDTCAV